MELSQTEAQTLNLQLFLVLKILLSLEFIVVDLGISRSRYFVKQLNLVQR